MEACPCCHHITLPERKAYDICPVCFWEDDGNNDPDGDPGPNGSTTLRLARRNYVVHGVSDLEFKHLVRKPTANEMPSEGTAE
jgi:cysteine-rich CPCC protein